MLLIKKVNFCQSFKPFPPIFNGVDPDPSIQNTGTDPNPKH